jgi:uncharacterized protein (DUF433 family)
MADMDTVLSIDLIASNPKVRGGRPCIAGTTLRVTDVVVASIFHDRTPGEIASDYELTLAQVHAALAYYYQHKEALDSDLREQIKRAAELKEKRVGSGNRPSLLP